MGVADLLYTVCPHDQQRSSQSDQSLTAEMHACAGTWRTAAGGIRMLTGRPRWQPRAQASLVRKPCLDDAWGRLEENA